MGEFLQQNSGSDSVPFDLHIHNDGPPQKIASVTQTDLGSMGRRLDVYLEQLVERRFKGMTRRGVRR